MEYLLVVYICSALDGECVIPQHEGYYYPKTEKSHSSCVKHGLGEAFDILYGENFFTDDVINQYELYPKFSCVPVSVEESPEVPGIGTPS